MILSKYRPLTETFYSRKLTAQPQNLKLVKILLLDLVIENPGFN